MKITGKDKLFYNGMILRPISKNDDYYKFNAYKNGKQTVIVMSRDDLEDKINTNEITINE
jgi:hypothetical protein